MAVYRLTACRTGRGSVLAFHLPAAMSRALPDGNHEFEVEFVEAGILLTYVGPRAVDGPRKRAIEDTPGWAK